MKANIRGKRGMTNECVWLENKSWESSYVVNFDLSVKSAKSEKGWYLPTHPAWTTFCTIWLLNPLRKYLLCGFPGHLESKVILFYSVIPNNFMRFNCSTHYICSTFFKYLFWLMRSFYLWINKLQERIWSFDIFFPLVNINI